RPAEDLRALLHHQAPGTRHRSGTVDLLRHHRRAPGTHRGRIAGRRGLEFQGVPPGRMKILVVEDDKTVGQYVKRGLAEAGSHVELVGDGGDALRLTASGHYDLLVLDLRLPTTSGLDVLRTPGRVMPRTLITEYAWDYHFDPGTNIVDVVITRLRKKIDHAGEPKLIHTVRGVGYVVKA